jgi:hypothetical protein
MTSPKFEQSGPAAGRGRVEAGPAGCQASKRRCGLHGWQVCGPEDARGPGPEPPKRGAVDQARVSLPTGKDTLSQGMLICDA